MARAKEDALLTDLALKHMGEESTTVKVGAEQLQKSPSALSVPPSTIIGICWIFPNNEDKPKGLAMFLLPFSVNDHILTGRQLKVL